MGFETLELGRGLQGQKHLLQWQESCTGVMWLLLFLKHHFPGIFGSCDGGTCFILLLPDWEVLLCLTFPLGLREGRGTVYPSGNHM